MKEITIQIPDERLNFFMELMKELDFEVSRKYDIPEEHISIVRDRIKNAEEHPEQAEEWDKIKDQFNLDA
jgi:hypothetical protein